MINDESESLLQSALRVQLVELNNRSRWYSSQLWQVPFAYIGIAGIVLASSNSEGIGWVLLGLCVFGIFVVLHLKYIARAAEYAVRKLEKTEKSLNLEPTVMSRPGTYKPLCLALVGAVVVFLILGIIKVLEARVTGSPPLGP